MLKLYISEQDSNHSYCTPAGLTCALEVSKEAPACKTSCTGLYVDVFRADDTKLTTEMMKLANLVNVLANEGGPQSLYDITLKGSPQIIPSQMEV